MKLIGGAALLFSFTAAGMYAAAMLEKRIGQLKELEKAILFMSREIDYQLAPLAEAFLHTAKRTGRPWNIFFQEMGEKMSEAQRETESPEELALMAVNKIRKYHPWEKDLSILISMGKGLGELDKRMQLGKLKITEEEIVQAEKEAGKEQLEKGKLYQMLGVCMGILCIILII